ncbi:hypothetical protein EYF80_041692 [Liparis tanakae]|uniref:Uncharacterized protein n=1 Tax=Liparis tanakae TaxID=230148 RepID=A0A4Z2G4E4_9TELE|nr:hypothetical protein EYF80_041692 [Liparis tanakae]
MREVQKQKRGRRLRKEIKGREPRSPGLRKYVRLVLPGIRKRWGERQQKDSLGVGGGGGGEKADGEPLLGEGGAALDHRAPQPPAGVSLALQRPVSWHKGGRAVLL